MSKLYRVVSFVLSLTLFVPLSKAQEGPKVVEAITVAPATIAKSVKLIGLVKANKEAHLTSTINGVVKKIAAKEGARVAQGTLLAALDKPELARGANAAESNAKVAEQQYLRSRKLLEAEVISKEAFEASESAWSNAKIAAASAKYTLDQSEFRAPFDGVCGVFRVTVGANVNPGDEIVAFVAPGEITLEFAVPEVLVNKVKVGDDATVNKQAAKIVSVQRSLDPLTYMGLARATVAKCDECLVGAFVDVGVVVEKKDNAIGVPTEALFLKDGLQQVYIVRGGKAVLSPVTLGLKGDAFVEITKGVSKGDVVVTRGQNKLNEGADVKVGQ